MKFTVGGESLLKDRVVDTGDNTPDANMNIGAVQERWNCLRVERLDPIRIPMEIHRHGPATS